MLERLRGSRARYVIPNSITFLSLAFGVAAILASATGALAEAGALILISYVLDLFDGELARRLSAGSSFGLQLDSLVDMVSLGTAPAVLAFFHLRDRLDGALLPLLLWILVLLYTVAGAFRLARFNLLPTKSGQTDSVGLTISTSGATLTLAIVSDIAIQGALVPALAFLPFILFLAILMASRIYFPSLVWVFSFRGANIVYLLYFALALLVFRLPVVAVWLLFNIGFIGAGLVRALLRPAP
jgi:CDP-diacylglycerol---serine O-phosphatidyltransferase